ncbi:MAG: transglycosylase SLT domain-containing protein [Gemmatimonadetes bacterium]|nr:transglycosylase SLT domain-containing protein [Gemmatimonadota bacterium]
MTFKSAPRPNAVLALGALVISSSGGPAPLASQVADTLTTDPGVSDPSDNLIVEESPILSEARALLDAQMPVTAAALLARSLSTGAVEGDQAVLLAARAYADQRSWASTRRLLAGRAFGSPERARSARLLLARAYAGLDSTARAIDLYERVIEEADDAPPLSARVELAEAYGRLDRWAAAARQLRLAGSEHPDFSRWLDLSRLSALAEAADTAAFALADSLDRSGRVPADSALLPAARLAFAVGAPERGTQLARLAEQDVWEILAARHIGPHLLATGDTTGAAAAFRSALESNRATSETGPQLLTLDRSWRTLRSVARSDLRAGRSRRARGYLEEALELAPEGEERELTEALAEAHMNLGAPTRAAALLEPWTDPTSTRTAPASMWVLASRVFTALGRSDAATRASERAAGASGRSAALAAYLVADAHHDAGRPTEAAEAFEHAYRSFPGSSYGSRSLERLAMLAFHEARYDDAQALLQEYRDRYPDGGWALGALYWTGKTMEARGDTAGAHAIYLETLRRDPFDYYAILSAARTSRDRWAALTLGDDAPLPELHPIHADALERMNRLRDLGWVGRARYEYREARDRGPSGSAAVLAFAHALNESGWTQEGIRQGWRAKSGRVGWTRSLLRAIYPLPFRRALLEAARARDLPAHFVAGLSRRESMFDPEIRSVANAIGLMQVLPETARDVSTRAGLPEYRRAQLTVPEVNLLLGTQYLADVLGRFGGVPAAGMISYNAGPHRFTRWRDFPEFEDAEQLVERIPFRETREYVRAVTELTEIYRFLYPDLEPLTP